MNLSYFSKMQKLLSILYSYLVISVLTLYSWTQIVTHKALCWAKGVVEIQLEGKKVYINKEWKREKVFSFLQSHGFTLTLINNDQSPLESLIICLIQRITGNYWVTNLQEAIQVAIKSEKDYNRFLFEFQRKRKQLEGKRNEKLVQATINWMIGLNLKTFSVFREIQTITCLLENGKIFQVHVRPSNSLDENEITKRNVFFHIYFWLSAEDKGKFACIVPRIKLFRDPIDGARSALSDVAEATHSALLTKFEELQNDREFQVRVEQYHKNLMESKTVAQLIIALKRQCGIRDTKLFSALEDSASFDQNLLLDDDGKVLVDAIMNEVGNSLSRAYQDSYLRRVRDYELDRIQAEIAANEAKLKNVELKAAMEESEKIIEHLQIEVKKSSSSLFGNLNLFDKKKEELQLKKEAFAWNWFESAMTDAIPPYSLASKRKDHILFKIDEPVELLNQVFHIFGWDKKESNFPYLESYVARKNATSKIKNILATKVSIPNMSISSLPSTVDGSALVLSEVLEMLPKSPEQVLLHATSVLYIDCDWKAPGTSITLTAPRIEVTNSDEHGKKDRTIDTSGEDAPRLKKKANDGGGPGINGDHGQDGEPGQSAGNVTIQCQMFVGILLKIRACGGAGADGQCGGVGAAGRDGSDGEDGKLSGTLNDETWIYPAKREPRNGVNTLREVSYGKKGTPGGSGGNGGNGGSGGQGGYKGDVVVQCDSTIGKVDILSKDGRDGVDGQPGRGGIAGKGGRNGLDIARVFEPDPSFLTASIMRLYPIASGIGGCWREYRGDLQLEEARVTVGIAFIPLGDSIMGYKVIKKRNDNGRASDGQRGQDGRHSAHHQKKKAETKKPLVHNSRRKTKASRSSHANQINENEIKTIEAEIAYAAQQVADAESLKKDAEMCLESNRGVLKQKSASAKDTSRKAAEAEKTIQRKQSELTHLKSVDVSIRETLQIQSNYKVMHRLQRTADKEIHEEDDVIYDDIGLVTNENPSSTPIDSLVGVELLDALTSKHAADPQIQLNLAKLTQTLVAQINDDRVWSSVTNIIKHSIDDATFLIKSLKYINQDVGLVQMLISSDEHPELIENLKLSLASKNPNNKFEDLMDVLFQFRHMTWTYDEIRSLISGVDDHQASNSKVVRHLVLELVRQLVSCVAQETKQLYDVIQTEQVTDYHTLLYEIFQQSVSGKQDVSHKSTMAAVAHFFDDFIAKSMKIGMKTDKERRQILQEFMMEKLGANKGVESLLNNKPVPVEKIVFLLERANLDPGDLDKIRKWTENDLIVKDRDEIAGLSNECFIKWYWIPTWSDIFSVLGSDGVTVSVEPTSLIELRNAINLLRSALEWQYSGKSFSEKLKICTKLKEKLEKIGKKGFDKKVFEYIEKATFEVIGQLDEDNSVDIKTSFMTFIKRMEEVFRKLKEKNEARIMDKVKSYFPGKKEDLTLQFRRALYYYDKHLDSSSSVYLKPFELVAVSTVLRNIRGEEQHNTTLGSAEDWNILRKIHQRNWQTGYLAGFLPNDKEFHRVQDEIMRKWKETCIDSSSSIVVEPTKAIRHMQVLLAKYAALTSRFLPAQELATKWTSLLHIESTKLEAEIKSRMSKDFPRIGLLTSFKEDSITNKFNFSPGSVANTPFIEKSEARLDQWNLEYFSSVMDRLLLFLEENYKSDKHTAIVDFINEIGLFVECVQSESKDNSIDLTHNANILKMKSTSWRSKVNKLQSRNPAITADIVADVIHLLDSAERIYSNVEDMFLVDALASRTDRNLRMLGEAIISLSNFVQLLITDSVEDDQIDRVIEIVESLDPRIFNLDKSLNRFGLDHIWIEKKITLWNMFSPRNTLNQNIGYNLEGFIHALLGLTGENNYNLRLSIVAELCCELEKVPFNLDAIATISERLATLLSESKEDALNKKYSSPAENLCKIQQSLIKRYQAYHEQFRRAISDRNKRAIHLSSFSRLEIISQFIGRSQVHANQLLLEGLLRIDEQLDEGFAAKYITCVLDGLGPRDGKMKKGVILNVLYPPSGTKSVVCPSDAAYIERWIRTGCFQLKGQLSKMYDYVQSKKKVVNENNVNEAFEIETTYQIFGEENKKFINIVGERVAFEILRKEHPSIYDISLKERAVNDVYRKLLQLYDYTVNDLDEFVGSHVLLESYHYKAPERSIIKDLNEKHKMALIFQEKFSRCYFFAKEDNIEYEWLVWFNDIVLRSLKTKLIPLPNLNEFFHYSTEFQFQQLLRTTLNNRPIWWTNDLLVSSVVDTAYRFIPSNESQTHVIENEHLVHRLSADLHTFMKDCSGSRSVVEALREKLESEAQLASKVDGPIEIDFLADLVANLKTVRRLDDESNRSAFYRSPIKIWPKLIRLAKLTEIWTTNTAHKLMTMDRRLGPDKTNHFLTMLEAKYDDNKFIVLERVLKNLSKYPWMMEVLGSIFKFGQISNNYWTLLQDEERIKEHLTSASKEELNTTKIVDILRNDPDCSPKVKELLNTSDFVSVIAKIKDGRNHIKGMDFEKISTWTEKIKTQSRVNSPLDASTFLVHACHAVKLLNGYYPRDAQLMAVLIFVTSSGSDRCSRMAQISTGEGKTLITALLAIYHALKNWNGERNVNVVTSSPVLAEENVAQVEKLFSVFGVTVGNNCDVECADDEKVRRLRYNNDVIYGDLSSFQRDVLISRFFGRDVTKNREPGAIIIDEVDSMLLDKGENILYLSHKIPELDELLQVFVEIWTGVHAPDVLLGDDRDVALVHRFIRARLDSKDILIPLCLQCYVDRHLTAWIKNAFRAKYLVATNDDYKVDDIGDGTGRQVIVMDKETGVEQVQMHWSDGLHQFLQLKHTLRLSAASLKAVFMSNISYFNEYPGKLYGLTGTLGSTEECNLLGNIFNVDFFKMPRFKPRYCTEDDPVILGTEEEWLNDIDKVTQAQVLEKKRAVLIVCESIETAERIARRLKRDGQLKQVTMYTSSFDKEFQKRQQTTMLVPGDVIVATNLAGRGTDFRIDDQLNKNGGMHVIISYLPPNARVESQAEGRTARAGHMGSYQFVLTQSDGVQPDDDVFAKLERLKSKRNAKELRRLETIRTKGLQKILLEEKLFKRFQKEIYSIAKETLEGKTIRLSGISDWKVVEGKNYVQWQLDFLTNRWALWLDEQSHRINYIHLVKNNVIEVETQFENFKKLCLDLINNQQFDFKLVKFATMPSELLALGRYVTEAYESNTQAKNLALRCYEEVAGNEPNHCESALIRSAQLTLQKAGNELKRTTKKEYLVKAKRLIQLKTETLLAASDAIKRTDEIHRRAGAAQQSQNRFDEQITNLIGLLHIHTLAIDDILGRTVSRSFAMYFPNGEAEELADIVFEETEFCKPYRLSKKLTIKGEKFFMDKEVEWPRTLEYCRLMAVDIFRRKMNSNNYEIKENDLNVIIVTQQQLWSIVVKEKYICDEEITIKQCILPNSARKDENSIKIPKDLVELASVVTNEWLEKHGGQEWTHAFASLPLDTKKTELLKKALENQGYLELVEERRGKLIKEIPKDADELPRSLRPYHGLLAAWAVDHSGQPIVIGSELCREDAPCSKTSSQDSNLLWDHLLQAGAIKDRSLKFLMLASEDEIETKVTFIKEKIDSLKSIKDLCNKHRPTADVDQVNCNDAIAYMKDKSWYHYQQIFGAGASLIDTFTFGYATEILLESFIKDNESVIKQWKTESNRKDQEEKYSIQVVEALKSSAGQFKTMPRVSASFKPLIQYYSSGPCPPEVQDFEDQMFDQVIVLRPYKHWWDWRAFAVAIIGICQIAAGVAINVLSMGVLSPIGNALVVEGISDIIFSIQAGLTGTFSWRGYWNHKKWSLVTSVFTAGLGMWLTWSGAALRGAYAAWSASSAWSLLINIGKKALTKCGEAILSAFSSLAASQMLTYLKKYILDTVLGFIRDTIVGTVFRSSLQKMKDAVAAIWTLMKKAGRSTDEAKSKINNILSESGQSELNTVWMSQASAKATTVGCAITRCFHESGVTLDERSQQLESKGLDEAFGESSVVGSTTAGKAFDALNKAKKLKSWMETSQKIISWVRNGTEIASLVTHAPQYIDNTNLHLELEQSKLKTAVLSEQVASPAEDDSKELAAFQDEITRKVGDEVVNRVVDRIENAWVQPWLQRNIESVAKSLGKRTVKFVGSLFDDEDDDDDILKRENDRMREENERSRSKDKGSGRRGRGKRSTFTGELSTCDEGDLDEDSDLVEKELMEKNGEGAFKVERDLHGDKIVQPTSFPEFISGLGEGSPASLLAMEATANSLGVPIQLEDETGKFSGKTGGTHVIYPNDKESSTKPIKVRITNKDGIMHAQLYGPDGQLIDVPSSGTNRCFFDAIAHAQGVSPDKLIEGIKSSAFNDDRVKYKYNLGIDEALSHLNVGATAPNIARAGQPANVHYIKDSQGRVTRVIATVNRSNLRGGSSVDPKLGKEIRNQGREGQDQAGHLIGKLLGGSGSDPNNLVAMDGDLNNTLYKRIEFTIGRYVNENPNDAVTISIFLGYSGDNERRPSMIDYQFKTNNLIDLRLSQHLRTPFMFHHYSGRKGAGCVHRYVMVNENRESNAIHERQRRNQVVPGRNFHQYGNRFDDS